MTKEQATTELKEHIIPLFNQEFGTRIRSAKGLESNYVYWREDYSLEDMLNAVKGATLDPFWSKKITLSILFRKKNPNKEEVNRIEDMLMLWDKHIEEQEKEKKQQENIESEMDESFAGVEESWQNFKNTING